MKITVGEIRSYKKSVENRIMEFIQDQLTMFKDETGMTINDISIYLAQDLSLGGEENYYVDSVQVSVSL